MSSQQPTASTDFVQLAELARRQLADADEVILLVDGLAWSCEDEPAILMHEHDGVPTFVCEPGSALVAATGRVALLTVADESSDAEDVATVLLKGTLQALSRGVTVVIQLSVAEVVVESQNRHTGAVRQQVVPLPLYSAAGPQVPAKRLDAMIAHTNNAHQEQLRRLLAANLNVAPGEIAGARIERLDRDGALIRWIGTDGSHTTSVGFDPPARNEAELVCLLRDAVADADRGEHR